MKNISLAAKYRPQDFASIIGQETIKDILKKTAFEEKVAPAYLLSGTRGVGKTTIARVFAKALNCENKKDTKGEPCNTCPSCISITNGAHVDVIEIDAASNRGVDEARKIREQVVFAPFEGKYRIMIIDEAHMLTKEAFNALLKTLEEPPAHTTFVLATTEAHKFPITIVSRCQHFVFKHVPDTILNKHLKHVLESENYKYEDEAINILIQRAAGSVRDSMSLLSQSLVLANDKMLSAELVRSVLGLAGSEIIEKLLTAIAENNTVTVATTVQDMISQALDISYFVKNLSQLWRSFFLIKQHKTDALKLLNISENEGNVLLKQADKFSLSFIHAAWQMTLEAQQKIIKSLEPAVALELFLINLAILPKLLPINDLNADFDSAKLQNTSSNSNIEEEKKKLINAEENTVIKPKIEEKEDVSQAKEIEKKKETVIQEEIETKEEIVENTKENIEISNETESTISVEEEKNAQEESSKLDFADFIDYLRERNEQDLVHALQHIKGIFEDNTQGKTLLLKAPSSINANQLKSSVKEIADLLKDWSKQEIKLDVSQAQGYKNYQELKKELEKEPIIQEIQSTFNASIIFCESLHSDFVINKKTIK